jgi:hypothetical protein
VVKLLDLQVGPNWCLKSQIIFLRPASARKSESDQRSSHSPDTDGNLGMSKLGAAVPRSRGISALLATVSLVSEV